MYPVDGVSGVVANELIDETEDVLLLWALEDIGPLGTQRRSFYRSQTEIERGRKVWRYCG